MKNVITKTVTQSVVNAFWVEGGEFKTAVVANVLHNITDSAARTLVKKVTGNPNAGVNVQKNRVTYEIDADVFFRYARALDTDKPSAEFSNEE